MTGAELRRLRARLRLTQEQMSERLNIDRRTLGRYERNEAPIPRVIEYAVHWLAHLILR